MSITINKVYEVKTARKYEILVLVTNDDDECSYLRRTQVDFLEKEQQGTP